MQQGAADSDFSQRFATNAAWTLSAQLVAKLASFLFFVVVARGIGTREFGYFSFVVSFVPLVLMFGMWGLELAVVREVARNKERVSELFMSGFIARILLGGAALLLAFAAAPLLLEGRSAYLALFIVGPALFIDELSGFVGTVFKAFEELRVYSIVLVTNRIVSALLALAVVGLGGKLVAVSAMYLLGSLGAFIVAWIILRRRFPTLHARDFDRDLSVELLKQGVPLGIAGVLNMAVFRIDSVLLQVIRGPVAVGMYGVAYRFLDSFLFVAWTLANVVFPRIARAGATRVSSRTHEFTTALIISFYLPLAVGSLFAGEWVVVTLFGERYSPAAEALPALTAAGVFYGIAYLSRVGIVGLGRRREVAWIAAGALILNVGLNLAVIPSYGFTGAAAVTLATEVFEAALLFALFKRATEDHGLPSIFLVPALAAGAMAAVLWPTGLRDGRAIALGAIVYVGVLIGAARLLAPDAYELAIGLWRRRGRSGAEAEGATESPPAPS